MGKNRGSYLSSGERLNIGDYLSSNGSTFYATMQSDGNFVIYFSRYWFPNNAIWSTFSNIGSFNFNRPYCLLIQDDGNLVIYDSNDKIVWTSGFGQRGLPPHKLWMQGDGNLVLYDKFNNHIWSTGTHLISKAIEHSEIKYPITF